MTLSILGGILSRGAIFQKTRQKKHHWYHLTLVFKGRSLTAGLVAVIFLLDVFHGRSTTAITVIPPPLWCRAASSVRAPATSPSLSVVPPVGVLVPVSVPVIPRVPLGTATGATGAFTFASRTVGRGASVVTPNRRGRILGPLNRMVSAQPLPQYQR